MEQGVFLDMIRSDYTDGGCGCIIAVICIPLKIFCTVLEDPRELIGMVDTMVRNRWRYGRRILDVGIFKGCPDATDPVLHVRVSAILMIICHRIIVHIDGTDSIGIYHITNESDLCAIFLCSKKCIFKLWKFVGTDHAQHDDILIREVSQVCRNSLLSIHYGDIEPVRDHASLGDDFLEKKVVGFIIQNISNIDLWVQ